MDQTIPTPHQLLREARAIIARPECWTQGAGARDADGEPVDVGDEDTVSWCADGALICAMYRHANTLDVPLPLQQAFENAHAMLEDTVRALTRGRYSQTTTYNDTTNHGCIVHTFDIAISDAERLAEQPAD